MKSRRDYLDALAAGRVARAEAREAGRVRYCVSVPCAQGHTAERYTATGACVECVRLHAIRWRAKWREMTG